MIFSITQKRSLPMPIAKLTKAFVEQVAFTEGKQIVYADTDLPGFYLIVGSATKTYAAQGQIKGRSIRVKIGKHTHVTTLQARDIARQKLFMMSQGVDPREQERQERSKAITVEQIFERYIEARKNLRPVTIKNYRTHIDLHLAEWKHMELKAITKEMIVKMHGKVGERHGIYMANKSVRLLRALFNHAEMTYDLGLVNPVSYLSHVKGWYKQKSRTNYIKVHDLPRWWEAVHALQKDSCRDILLVLLFTGMRRSEACGMRWENIDFIGRTFTIPQTKNGDPLTLPMSQFIYELLLRRHEKYGHKPFVFPGRGTKSHILDPKKGIDTVERTSGIKFTAHDLRRTFVTFGESLEIAPYSLKRLLNHRVTDITGSYIILDVERLREPTEKIARFILENVQQRKE